MRGMLEKEKLESAQSSTAFVQEAGERIRAIQTKLQRLLDGYLEQDIEREVYQEQKAVLLSEKKSLEEQMARIEQKRTGWLEPALGEPRRARRASISIPFRASRGRIGRAKTGKFDIGARGRNRTGMGLAALRILSPVRLPISPPGLTLSFILYSRFQRFRHSARCVRAP